MRDKSSMAPEKITCGIRSTGTMAIALSSVFTMAEITSPINIAATEVSRRVADCITRSGRKLVRLSVIDSSVAH